MADIKVGDEFRVLAIEEWIENKVILARYRPEFTYRVTDRNIDFVSNLIDSDKAQRGRQADKRSEKKATDVEAKKASARGLVSTIPKKKPAKKGSKR